MTSSQNQQPRRLLCQDALFFKQLQLPYFLIHPKILFQTGAASTPVPAVLEEAVVEKTMPYFSAQPSVPV